eukprot:9001463-Alexandrium_andersonii.AAC.1
MCIRDSASTEYVADMVAFCCLPCGACGRAPAKAHRARVEDAPGPELGSCSLQLCRYGRRGSRGGGSARLGPWGCAQSRLSHRRAHLGGA